MSRPVEANVLPPRQVGLDAQGVRVETIGQAAAGALLLSIAVAELLLGFWARGWDYRAVALAVAGIGAAFLASGAAEIAIARRGGRRVR